MASRPMMAAGAGEWSNLLASSAGRSSFSKLAALGA